jgi:phosphoribosylglycinamide formyltransferase-1
MSAARRMTVGVMISGRGSNLQALLDACARPDYPARVVLVVSNRPDAPGLARAEAAGVPTQVIDHRDYASRETFDAAVTEAFEAAGVELICMAGFLRLLTEGFVDRWRDRLINIHPAILPAFKGLDTHARALATGAKLHGCTVHYVRFDMDTGPIVGQAAVPVLPDDDEARLAARVLAAEHRLYPRCLRLIAEGRVRIAGDAAIVAGATPDPAAALINPSDS